MYAVIEVGGKQINIKEKDMVEVEKQDGKEGKDIVLGRVLLVCKGKKIEFGKPYIKEAKVTATIIKHHKAKKVISFKYRRRKSSAWKKGHRQQLTRLLIKEIRAE
jgi:large subunit ribosomal protein L21